MKRARIAVAGFMSIGWAALVAPCAAQTHSLSNVTIIAGFGPDGQDQPTKQSNRHTGPIVRVEQGLAQMIRLYSRHLHRFIPGVESISTHYLPGGGGLRAANFIAGQTHSSQNKVFLGAIPVQAVRRSLLQSGVSNRVVDKLVPLTAMTAHAYFCALRTNARHGFGRQQTKSVIFGATQPGSRSWAHARAYAEIGNIRMKLISGYPSPAATAIALIRGEIEGMCGWSFAALQTIAPKLIASGQLRPMIRVASSGDSRFSHIMTIAQSARKSEFKNRRKDLIKAAEVLEAEVILSFVLFTSVFMSPKMRSQIDNAIVSMLGDTSFLLDAKTRGLAVGIVPRKRVQDALVAMKRTPEAAKKVLRNWYGHK